MCEIETKKCDCTPPEGEKLRHRGYCNKNPNGLATENDEKCCCIALKKNHTKKCQYSTMLRAVVAEWNITPIVGFNSGKYDMCFVVNAMDGSNLPIKKSINKGSGYMALQFGKFMFLDARNFVAPNIDLKKFGLMFGVKDIQKELFPYDWFDSVEKLQSTSLPPLPAFYNKLKDNLPSETEYTNAIKIWHEHKFTCFREYMMYYCECDVDLLIQGLNNYRDLFWETSKMEILSFVSLPQMAYTDLLKN